LQIATVDDNVNIGTKQKEVAYVDAGRIIQRYREFTKTKGIEFSEISSIRPYDQTTLFCVAGMQQYKPHFLDQSYVGTVSNSQSCMRLDDLDEIGDGTHSLHFEMLGLFSFRKMSLQETVDFWLDFLGELGIWPDHVTIHPDKMNEWKSLYPKDMTIMPDPDCTWSDGNVSGYCTEFYKDGIEIGNIVNPLGDCIDCGFGLGRLITVMGGDQSTGRMSVLKDGVQKLIESGYQPGNRGQGYVLRKLLRLIVEEGGVVDHPFFTGEVERQKRLQVLYERLKPKNLDKTPEWWFDTHGIVVER
jgi:alanyl-tRNA synthetase